MDVHQDAQQADPSRPAARGSNTPPQSLLPPFQEETPRATRTTITAPPAMTGSASKGSPPPPSERLAPHLQRATQQAQPGKMSYTSESLPPGLGPGHTLSIVQHNCLGSWDVFLSLFNSFASAKDPPLIVCLQDPPVWRNQLPSHSGFTSIAPSATGRRPRVAFYVFRSLIDMTTITPIFMGRSDIATLEITAPSLFGTTMKSFHIINC